MKLTEKYIKPMEKILANENATIDQQLQAASIIKDIWLADVRQKIERGEIMKHITKRRKKPGPAVTQAQAQMKNILEKLKSEQ